MRNKLTLLQTCILAITYIAVMVHTLIPHHIHNENHPHIHLLGLEDTCSEHSPKGNEIVIPTAEKSFTQTRVHHHHENHCLTASTRHLFLIHSKQAVRTVNPILLLPYQTFDIAHFHSSRYALMIQHLSYVVPQYFNRYTYHYIARSLGLRAPPMYV